MSHSVILRRCATLPEAHICVGLLKANNIWASIDNAEHAAQDWGSIPALGGVHVRVFSSNYDAARQLIIDVASETNHVLEQVAGAHQPITVNRRWRAVSMLIIWLGLLNFLVVPLLGWLDEVIPKEWVPNSKSDDFWIGVSQGVNTAPPGPGAEGALLVTLISLFLLWELVTTQRTSNKKDPDT